MTSVFCVYFYSSKYGAYSEKNNVLIFKNFGRKTSKKNNIMRPYSYSHKVKATNSKIFDLTLQLVIF